MRSVGPGEDRARFLADLRALRDTAAIGYEELAARAHYPSDVLKEAENGPTLPSLPVLTAYIRACDGNVLEWEERWRRLGDGTRADPNLPVRPAGASAAAVAGARAGVGVAPPEAYDPDRIKAALRTDHRRSAGTSLRAGQQRTPAVGAHAADTGSADHHATGWDSRETGSGWDAGVGRSEKAGWDGSAAQDSTHRETGAGWFTTASPDAGGGWDSPGETEGAWNAGVAAEGRGSWDSTAASDAGSSWGTAAGDTGSSRDTAATNAESSRDTATAPSTGASWDTAASTNTGASWDTTASTGTGASWDIAAAATESKGSWDAAVDRDAGSSWSTGAVKDGGSVWDIGTSRASGGSWDAGGSRETGSAWDAGDSRGTGSAWSTGTSRDAGSGWDSGVSGETAAGLGSGAGWEAPIGQDLGLPNRNHHAERPGRGPFEAAVTETADAAGPGTDWQPEDARASWTGPTSPARESERSAPEPASEPTGRPRAVRAAADLSQAGDLAAAAQPRASAERAASAAPVTAAPLPGSRRRERPGMWRLLAIIVLAALLGSVLMLLLR